MRSPLPVAVLLLGLVTSCGPETYSSEKADEVFAEQIQDTIKDHASRFNLDASSIQDCVAEDYFSRSLDDKRIIVGQMLDEADTPAYGNWAQSALTYCWQLSPESVLSFEEALDGNGLTTIDIGRDRTFVDPTTQATVVAASSPTTSIATVTFELEEAHKGSDSEATFVLETLKLINLGFIDPGTSAEDLTRSITSRQTTTVNDSFRICYEAHDSVDAVQLGSIHLACDRR